MSREISVRERRHHTAAVVAAVRAGERASVTVNRMPVANIVPRDQRRNPWVPSEGLREIAQDDATDQALLADLADVRGPLLDE